MLLTLVLMCIRGRNGEDFSLPASTRAAPPRSEFLFFVPAPTRPEKTFPRPAPTSQERRYIEREEIHNGIVWRRIAEEY